MKRNITKVSSRIFHDIQWKIIVKDAAKFYIYLVTLYGLAFLLIWGRSHWSLESYKINLDNTTSTSSLSAKLADFDSYKLLTEDTGYYMFALVCFSVFFKVPPKKLTHVIIATTLISLIGSPVFLYDSLLEWSSDIFCLYATTLLAWLSSYIWVRLN